MSKKCPKGPLGLPGSLPEKCPKNVWKMSWCWAWRWKMSKKCQKSVPQTFSRHFLANREVAAFGRHPKGGARASRAPPPFGSLLAKKCQKSVWKISGDTFLTLFGHFLDIFPAPAPAPGHFPDTFWTFFWEAARKSQKAFWDIFWTFFGNLSF